MDAYLDKDGMKHLLEKIKEIMKKDDYQELLGDLLERILSEDKIQRITKLVGIEVMDPNTSRVIIVPCGFDAYEIKTIAGKNITNGGNIQFEILEDDVRNQVIFKSLLKPEIYTNAGDVCNIDEQGCKAVYLRIINPNLEMISVSYEIKLLNLLVAKPKEEGS